MEFTRDYLIRWSHCDGAGIVFFPQYFVLFNDHVEDWFASQLGTDFAVLHQQRGLGIPTVRIECDFTNPSRLGDRVEFALTVSRLGDKSVSLSRQARVGDEIRVQLSQVLVCMNLATGQAASWPDDLRSAMQRNLLTDG